MASSISPFSRFTLFILFGSLLLSLCGCIATASSGTECHFTSQRVQCGDRTCKENKCVRCTDDADCYEEGMRCDKKVGGLCKLKSLHDNLNLSAFFAALLSIAVCCIGIVAGVGGGGVLVPLFSVLMSLPVSFAVVVSQLTIVGQSIFSFSYIVNRLHDVDESRPLVNYQYLSLLMPMAIAGTSVGVQLGRVLPDIARILLLIFTFVALLRRLVAKAVEQFRSAQRSLRAPSTAASTTPVSTSQSATGSNKRAEVNGGCKDVDEDEDEDDSDGMAEKKALNQGSRASSVLVSMPVGAAKITSEKKQPRQQSSGPVPISDPVPLQPSSQQPPSPTSKSPLGSLRTEILIVVTSVTFLLFGAVARQLSQCGTPLHSVLSIGPLIVLLGVFWFAYRRLSQRLGVSPLGDESDSDALHFDWNANTALLFPVIAIGAGAAASMLGIGGGLILGFLLFEAGLTPQESSATSSVATLLMAGESVIQLSLAGNVQFDYALAFLGVGAFSGFIGQKVIMPTIKQKGWHFLIIGALTLIVALSMVCLVSLAVYQAAVGLKESSGSLFVWGTLCKKRFVEDTVHG